MLDFLAPLFSERETEAVKGVGWGLKTLGRHYPDLVTDWLVEAAQRPYHALTMRKALTFLDSNQRARVRSRGR